MSNKVVSARISNETLTQLEELRARCGPRTTRSHAIRLCVEGYLRQEQQRIRRMNEASSTRRLSLEQVIEIVRLYEHHQMPYAIARRYGIPYRTVLAILSGRTWAKELRAAGVKWHYGLRECNV
jgi:hypothetical protein